MVKRSAQTFAIALLFAATIAPVVHGFSHGSKSVPAPTLSWLCQEPTLNRHHPAWFTRFLLCLA